MRWIGAIATAWGCYAPHPQPGAPCASGSACPSGLECIAGTCAPPGTLPPDARFVDGPPDAHRVDAPASGVSIVQQIAGFQAQAMDLTVTLPMSPRAGDVLVMTGASVRGELTGLTGGGVAIWTRAAGSTDNQNTEIWYGVSDGSSASVTFSSPTARGDMWAVVSEWSGLATTNTLDNAIASSGLASPAAPPQLSTAFANDLVILSVADLAPNSFGTPTPGTWNALDPIVEPVMQQSEWYAVASLPGTITVSVSETAHEWDAAIAAFRIGP